MTAIACPDSEAHRARYFAWRARDERDRIAARTRARNVQAWLEADGDLEAHVDPVAVAAACRSIRRACWGVLLLALGLGVAGWLRWG